MGIVDQGKIKKPHNERIVDFERFEIVRLAYAHPDHALSPLFVPTQRFQNESPGGFTLRVSPHLKILSKHFQSGGVGRKFSQIDVYKPDSAGFCKTD